MTLRLYYLPGACSMAAHIALEESGIAVEATPVLVSKGENGLPAHLAIHPRGFVPVLDIDGHRLTEVVAMLFHIARRNPTANLFPEAGSLTEARTLELCAWLTNTLHIAYARLWRPERFTSDDRARKIISDEAKGHIDALNHEIESSWPGKASRSGGSLMAAG